MRGESYSTCAQRSDHVIECHDGQTYDFGPLRDFDVTTDRDVLPAGPSPGYVPGTDPYSLCVITIDDAIECVGDRYSQEVLDQLPAGPLE